MALLVGLEYENQLPGVVRDELDQILAAVQTYSRGVDGSIADLEGGNYAYTDVENLFSVNQSIAATKKLFLDGGGDTYLIESSANVLKTFVGGSEKMAISTSLIEIADGVALSINPADKLYLDGGGDTYIFESSANTIRIVNGTVVTAIISPTHFQIGGGVDFTIEATKKFYLDGGGDTYIIENATDRMSFFAGAQRPFWVDAVAGVGRAGIDAAIKFYLDGGSDTYIFESAADVMNLVVGGQTRLRLNTTNALVNAGDLIIDNLKKFYLDGGSDTYIYEAAANILHTVVGGTIVGRFDASSFSVYPTHKLYLDGGSDTYFQEAAADDLRCVVGGNGVWQGTASLFSVGVAATMQADVDFQTYPKLKVNSTIASILQSPGNTKLGNTGDNNWLGKPDVWLLIKNRATGTIYSVPGYAFGAT